MVKLTDKSCSKHNISFGGAAVLIAIACASNEDYETMITEGLITRFNPSAQEFDRKFSITHKGINLIEELIADSNEEMANQENRLETLAEKLREIYPTGKIAGTSYYYKGNKTDISRKLKSFFRRYGSKYTDKQIIEATRKYIESFNGNYTYLKLLKYFIWKDEVKDGEVVQTSVLADYIENLNQGDDLGNSWLNEVR